MRLLLTGLLIAGSRFRRDWKLPYPVVFDTENVMKVLGDPREVAVSFR